MKTIIKYMFISLVTVAIISCDSKYEPTLETILSDFGFVTNDTSMVLTGTSTKTVRLKWEKSTAENSTLVFYKVQFSDDQDDFSSPTYELLPGRLGSNNFVEISDSMLNIIAEKSSIRQLSTEKMYWRVIASNGINSKIVEGEKRFIEVTRPAGFAAFPEKLYITGTATPGGDDLSKAIQIKVLKKKSDPTLDSVAFNIVLPLKQGEFKLVNALQGRTRTFGFDNDGKFIEIFEDDNIKTTCPADGLYQISLNFITNVAEYASVNLVELVVIRNNTPDNIIATMNYTTDYTWQSDFVSKLSDGANLPTGAMYKFRFSGNKVSDNSPFTAYWGSPADTSTPPNATTPESYFYVTYVENNLKNYYRFATAVSGSNSGKNMRAVLVMNPVNTNYYHTCTVIE